MKNFSIHQQNHFASVTFHEELIKKYNQQAPRYTSYPTALEFSPISSDDSIEQHILKNRDSKRPLSLYIHIPFCRHLCYYCGCNKIITKKNSDSGDYLDYLFAEILHKKSFLTTPLQVKQVHLGGGTPTFLSDDELILLWQFLKQHFDFVDDGDFSVEIDPRELRENTLTVLKNLGVNRLSFGVQDLEEKVQIAVNRVQPEHLIENVMTCARQLGFKSINIDLIYGLPHQTVASMATTIQKIIALSPDRLSLFNYAHLPSRFTPQKRINEADLPSPESKLTMFKNAITALNQANYQYIGIDHFAKPSDEMAKAQRQGRLHRNFQGYTILGECDLLGFGVSSISQIGEHMLQNPTSLGDYQEKIHAKILPAVKHVQASPKDALRRDVIMNLLCHDVMDFADLNLRFGIDCQQYFAEELQGLQAMQDDDLLKIDKNGVQILPKGRILGRSIAMVFDEYLVKKHQNRFSRVI